MYRRASVHLLHSKDDPKNPSKAVVTMTNYKNMSREAEAELVPDWIHTASRTHYKTRYGGTRLQMNGSLLFMQDVSKSDAVDLLPALAFFAANGRLPRRLSDGGAV